MNLVCHDADQDIFSDYTDDGAILTSPALIAFDSKHTRTAEGPMTTTEGHQDFYFIQMADVQFGLFAALSGADEAKIERGRLQRLIIRPAPRITGFADETMLYTRAIDATNRLQPDFVVMCGDMTNDSSDPAQLAELRRMTALLSEDIPMNWVAGNHDIGNELTTQSLAMYRERYGADKYFFDHRGSRFIVINSNVAFYQPTIPEEWESMLDFLSSALQEARAIGTTHILLFTSPSPLLREPRRGGLAARRPGRETARPFGPAPCL